MLRKLSEYVLPDFQLCHALNFVRKSSINAVAGICDLITVFSFRFYRQAKVFSIFNKIKSRVTAETSRTACQRTALSAYSLVPLISRFAHLALAFLCIRAFPLVCVKDNTSPAHCPLRYPIMNTRFRDCGTPKFLLLSTCQHTSYPSSAQALLTRFDRKRSKARPLCCASSPQKAYSFSGPPYGGLFQMFCLSHG